LLTNDTDLADRLTDPESGVWKVYRVEVAPRLGEAALERLARGVVLDDGPTRPARVRRVKDRGPRSLLEIELSEGRNREVRRMIAAVGGRVRRLARVAVGPLRIGDLPAGRWRRLSAAEVRRLRQAAGAPARAAPARPRGEGRAR
jgi:pseudouridine synthase